MKLRPTNIEKLSNHQKKDICRIITEKFKLLYKNTDKEYKKLRHITNKYEYLRKLCEKLGIPYKKALYTLQYRKYYFR